MTKFKVTVTLKTGEVFTAEMNGSTYENILDQVKEKCFDINNLKSVETEEMFKENDGNECGWELVYDDLYSYDMIIGGIEQRYVYELGKNKMFHQVGEETVGIPMSEMTAAILEKLANAILED